MLRWFRRRQTAADRPVVEAVEPRILYSADLAAALGTVPAAEPAPEVRVVDANGDYAVVASASTATPAAIPAASTTALPLAFEHNVGQAGDNIDYLARGNGYVVGLSKGDAIIVLGSGEHAHGLTLSLAGANADTTAVAGDTLDSRTNYLTGSDSSQWHTNLSNYGCVTYRNVYDGIDLRYYGNARALEYDFIVGPGADASRIALGFAGAESASIDGDGNLVLDMAGDNASVRFLAPIAYQEGTDGREAVASRYVIGADGRVRFELGAYDATRALVIDPVLAYGTYFGGAGAEGGNAIAVDNTGSVYLAGYSASGSLLGNLLGLRGGEDIFVTKLASSLASATYTTYLGGLGNERATAIAVDAAGHAYITGWTTSASGPGGFPTASPYQSVLSGSQDAFVMELAANGASLEYSTYLGGSGSADAGNGIAIDSGGAIYVAGTTTSSDFPTSAAAPDKSLAGEEAFVTKLNPVSNQLVYSTFIGGTGNDHGLAITLDSSNRAVIAGTTNSGDFATSGATQASTGGGYDAFVVKMSSAGNTFNYATYFGGSGDDSANAVAMRSDGTIAIGGGTQSGNLPTTAGAAQSAAGSGGDGFVAVLNPSTGALTYSTYLGGNGGSEAVYGLAVDAGDRIYVGGATGSSSFPVTSDAHQATLAGGSDGFIALVNPAGGGATDLLYATYIGGNGTDVLRGLANAGGGVYAVGDTTSSSAIALAGAADTSYGGGDDAFAVMLDATRNAPVLRGANNLADLTEDPASNAGTLVSSLIAGKVSDIDVGALAGIAVTAVDNAHGSWQYSTNGGTSWLAFGSVSASSSRLLAADASTYVRFVPNANWNGTLAGGLAFRAWDQTSGSAGGTADTTTNGGATAFSLAAAASGITITPVNDAPTGANKTVSTLEDTAYVFGVADFGFADPQDSPANALANVRIASLPSPGTLTLSGSVVVAGQSVSAANIVAGNLRYTPGTGGSGSAYAAFTFQVQDDGGTANGGVNLDAVARSMTIDVIDVNQAPVLAGSNAMSTITEDTVTNPGTLVSALIAGRVTDTDAVARSGIAVVAVDNSHGAWQYSTDGGGSWSAFGAASSASARLLAADAATRVRFNPAADWNGVVGSGLTFRAWDGTSGVAGSTADATLNGGTTAFSTATAASSITVTAVNDAPSGSDGVVSMAEDTPHVFSIADFGFSDAHDSPAHALAAVRLVSVTGGGTLTNAGVAVSAGQEVTAADIAAGRLAFNAAANASGAGYASLTFQVRDEGGTANGGVDLDPVTRTLSVDVSAVNDAPTLGLPPAQSTTSNTAVVFSAGLGNAITLADVDAGAVPITITLAAANGTLTLSATTALSFASGTGTGDASMSFSGTLTDINAALEGLRFDPATGYSGSTAVTLSANDLGNAGSGGAKGVAGNIVINVAHVNSAPVLAGSNLMSGISEDALTNAGTSVTALVAGHMSDADAGALTGIAVIAADNSHGTWQYSIDGGTNWTAFGPVLASSARLLAADAATAVRFVPTANWNGSVVGGLSFRAWDQTAGAAGGIADVSSNGGSTAFSAASADTGIVVGAVNDAPAGTSRTISTLEDTPYVFSTADFGFTDSTDSPANALAAVKISTLPGAGTLTDNGVAVVAGQYVSATDIAAGKLAFSAAANASGTGYASFGFQLKDDGGTSSGGVDLDQTTRTLTINVNAVNDAPAGTSRTINALEDTTYVFSAADFGFTDSTDSPANTLAAVKISTLAGAGALTNNGVAVVAGQFVSAADIAAGKLAFSAAADASGTGYASFGFQLRDDGGTSSGGIDLDPTTRTLTIDVGAVNDAPAGTSRTINALEDTAYVFSAADFGFTDSTDSPANALAAVKISTLPGAGTLTDNGVAVVAGQFVSAADIAAGRLQYAPDTDATGSASFTFQVGDDGGTANGGVNLDPLARTLTVAITPVNDAPVGIASSVTAGTAYLFTLTDFRFGDTRDAPGNGLAAVRIATLPAAGSLTLAATPVIAGQWINAGDITAGRLRFESAGGSASFGFAVRDDGGTANGGLDTDTGTHTMTIAPPAAVAPAAPAAIATELAQSFAIPSAAAPVTLTPAATTAPLASQAPATPATTAGTTRPAGVDDAGAAFMDALASSSLAAAAADTTRTGATPLATGYFSGPQSEFRATGVITAERREESATQQPAGIEFSLAVAETRQGELAIRAEQVGSALRAPAFAQALDESRRHAEEEPDLRNTVAWSAGGATLGISFAYALWLVRGGVLMGSMLSAMPAWRVLDPLPVLSRHAEDDDSGDDNPPGDGDLFAAHDGDGAHPDDPARTLRDT